MTAPRPLHPFVWTLLIVPFGGISGFVGVVLAFLATRHGLTVEEGASLVAIGFLPHTWKFAWAPVVDMTLTRRRWYLLSAALCAGGVLAMAAVPLGPATLGPLRAVIFTVNLASTTLGMAVEGLMAHLTPPAERGRAGGWFQAGNLGGSGIGGGLGLWIATHSSASWVSGAVLAAVFAACAIPVWLVSDVPAESTGLSVRGAIRGVFADLWGMFKSIDGRLAALICFVPVGTGAAASVLAQATVAEHWGAGESEVGLVNGVLSGVIAAVGCLAGGELCRRFPARSVYVAIGALMAVVAMAMAVSPATPTVFIVGGLVYAFVTGMAFAAFTGLVLECIGAGAAATKYNIFAALSNTPIAYMGLVLAAAVTRYGAGGLLWVEAGAGFAGIALFLVVAAVVARSRGRAVQAA